MESYNSTELKSITRTTPLTLPSPDQHRDKEAGLEPPVQLQVGLGRGWRGDRRFVFEAVSQCAVFGGGTQLTVLGESPPLPPAWRPE